MTAMSGRAIAVLLALACWAGAGARAAEPAWPMWEPGESIDAYAKRAGLAPSQSFDLGNGETLEVVLLPAGSYRMGTPPPEEPPDRWYYGWAIMFLGLIFLVSFVSLVIARVYHKKAKLQLSLRHLLLVLFSLAVAMMGYMRWRENEARWRMYREEMETYEYTASNERPAHKVTLAHPVYIGKYEVTEGQFVQVWEMNSRVPLDPPDQAKSSILPEEAVDWCRSLGARIGRTARLPAEEEWEFAARGGTQTAYFFGHSPARIKEYASVSRAWGTGMPKVGEKEPNPFGLYDVYGSVREWCHLTQARYSAEEVIVGSPREGASQMVLRGGHCLNSPLEARSANRSIWIAPPIMHMRFSGFRVVVELPPEARPPAPGGQGARGTK